MFDILLLKKGCLTGLLGGITFLVHLKVKVYQFVNQDFSLCHLKSTSTTKSLI